VEWTDFSGAPMQWRDPGLSSLCLTLRCSAEAPDFLPDSDVVFVVFNRDDEGAEVKLPTAPAGQHWIRQIDTSIVGNAVYAKVADDTMLVNGQSVVALVLKSNTDTK
jgi:glycogen operon protein